MQKSAQAHSQREKDRKERSYLFHIRIVAFNPCNKHAEGGHQFR